MWSIPTTYQSTTTLSPIKASEVCSNFFSNQFNAKDVGSNGAWQKVINQWKTQVGPVYFEQQFYLDSCPTDSVGVRCQGEQ